VSVTALAKGYQDPHFVDPKPSFILAVSKADLLIAVGRELEIGWLPPLLTSGRNAKIQPGNKDTSMRRSTSASLKSRPARSRARMGDVPSARQPALLARAWERAGRIGAVDPRHALGPFRSDMAYSRSVTPDFDQRLAAARSAGTRDGAVQGHEDRDLSPVVAQLHGAFRSRRHGLRRAEAWHSAVAVAHARAHRGHEAQGVKLIVVEPYFDLKTPQAIANQVGGKVLVLAPSVGGAKEATRLHPAVRVRRQPAGEHAQAAHWKVGAWTGPSFSSWRRRSPPA
jgi:zinc/manganese transport system substrate-binding protein